MWLQWKSDDDDILLPKPLCVKQRSQPMEEHRPKKPLDQVCDTIRLKHYPYCTEQAYIGWVKRYI